MKIGNCDLYQYILPLMKSNMFTLISGKNALVIDPCPDPEAINMLKEHGTESITVILTHEHFDHIFGVNSMRAVEGIKECKVIASDTCAGMIPDPGKNLAHFFEAMFIARPEEERLQAAELFDQNYCCKADVSFKDHTELDWNGMNLKLRETPGHSPGSICIEIYDDSGSLLAVATGDSLVEGNKVITRLPGGDKAAYREKTRPYLESIPEDTMILPGHGAISLMKDLELG